MIRPYCLRSLHNHTPTQLIEHGENDLEAARAFAPSVHGTKRCSAHQRRKANPSICNGVLPAWYAGTNIRANPHLILLRWPRTRDYTGHRPGGKPNTTVLLKEHSNTMIPNDILLCSYIRVLLSHYQENTSPLGSRNLVAEEAARL